MQHTRDAQQEGRRHEQTANPRRSDTRDTAVRRRSENRCSETTQRHSGQTMKHTAAAIGEPGRPCWPLRRTEGGLAGRSARAPRRGALTTRPQVLPRHSIAPPPTHHVLSSADTQHSEEQRNGGTVGASERSAEQRMV